MSAMRTAIYVDGFNFFYWLKPTPYRWIDLEALAFAALAHPAIRHEIVAVKYFTARVSATADDPHKDHRQDVYLRALSARIPRFAVFFGEFRRKRKWMRRVTPEGRVGASVEVWSTEEKGSDVNLAVELMNDLCKDAFDLAVIVSNDSDFARALSIVKSQGKRVGVLVRGDAQVVSLRKVSHFQVTLRETHLKAALLPARIPGTHLRIPKVWRAKELAARIR
jgi:hypothetical protein